MGTHGQSLRIRCHELQEVQQSPPERRDALRCSLLLSLPCSCCRSRLGRVVSRPAQVRQPISVRDKGARGDGVHDDTAAFQAAIDALPAKGGTVTVPPGNYMIDALRAINMRSNMLLQMAPTAQLSAIPNNLPRSHVIKVWKVSNVQITGGRIVGERNGHLGTTGEWGYGLNIEASDNVSVADMHISDCWGDGIWIGALGSDGSAVPATHVTLTRVISTNNRRQGLSIGPVNGVTVVDSTLATAMALNLRLASISSHRRRAGPRTSPSVIAPSPAITEPVLRCMTTSRVSW
jgi:hypothetical protein